ncbi:hypothetical protein ABTB64_19730, partial [Acinetobacter baumannii]
IDLATHAVVDQTATEPRPRHVEFTPDGKELWVADAAGQVVPVVDPATRQPVATIAFAPPATQAYKVLPCGIRFTRDGKRAVVALG